MDTVYYPSITINSSVTAKMLILFWGKVYTIVPMTIYLNWKFFIEGDWNHVGGGALYNMSLSDSYRMYKEVNELAGEPLFNFLTLNDEEKKRTSETMFDLISHWNKDTGFYSALKIDPNKEFKEGDIVFWARETENGDKDLNLLGFAAEEIDDSLLNLLLEEKLIIPLKEQREVTPSGYILRRLALVGGYKEIYYSLLSIFAEEIKKNRNCRLITEDEFCIAAKSGVGLERLKPEKKSEEGYQLVSMAIPKVFIKPHILQQLSWEKVLKIRKDLLPLAETYYREIESYQESINSLAMNGKDEEAFDKFCEFCERVAISFTPFSREAGKILKLTTDDKAIGFLNGIILPAIKLLCPDPALTKICDTAAISSTVGKYVLSKKRPLAGFDYLQNLSRILRIESLKNLVTCLVPKKVKN